MTKLETCLLHVGSILLTLTGLVYAWMHYLIDPVDPFSVVNHPLEPYLLDAHIVFAPFLILGIGMILHSHILVKLENGNRVARRTGVLLLPFFAIMVLSGYLLQISTAFWRTGLLVTHLGGGALWAGFYLAHQIVSFRVRRTLSQN